MSTIAIYIIIMLVAAAAIIAASILIYNRRLDKVARGETRGTHSAIPEPRATAGAVYRIVLVVLAVITLLTVSTSAGLIRALQTDVGNLQSALRNVQTELYEVQEQLKKGDSFVKETVFDVTKPDYTKKTATVSYTVKLNRYTEDTAVTLYLNENKKTDLTKNADGTFGAEFKADLFDSYRNAAISVTENGVTVTEEADFPEEIFWDLLPMPMLACTLDSNYALGKLTVKGDFTVETGCPDEIETVNLTYMTSGRELKTVDITNDVLAERSITVDDTLQYEKDMTIRIEIRTKAGVTVTDQTVLAYESSGDYDNYEFLKITDAAGGLLWQSDKY